jgi:hypothetical protein
MAKKSSIGKELKKAQDLLDSDTAFRDLLKQISNEAKQIKSAESAENKRLRVPYVDAMPLNVSGWK